MSGGDTGADTGADVDVVVVGGGVCGLATAAVLTRRGHRVLVCEGAGELGGRARTTLREGFALNLGPRALYRGPLARLLREHGALPPIRRSRVEDSAALLDGAVVPGFAAPAALATSRLLSLRERVAVAAFLVAGERRPGRRGRTAQEWLADALPTPRSRAAVFGLLRVSCYVGSPAAIGAESLGRQLALVRSGVDYVDGGWAALVARLSAGLPVRTGAVVRHAGPDGVELADGTTVAARAVVVAGLSPTRTADVLGVPLPVDDLTPVRTGCLDVALSRLPHRGRSFVYGLDEPLYCGVYPDDDGGAVVHVARYDDGRAVPPAQVRARLEALLDTCQPGWRDHVVHARFLPGMTTMHAAPDVHRGDRARELEAALSRVPGVFVAGDWTGDDALLADACVTSAVRACDRVSARLDRVSPRLLRVPIRRSAPARPLPSTRSA